MLGPGRPNMWNSGCCSTFAVVLQELFGGDLMAIYDPNEEDLYHAFCVINDLAYDADGPHELTKICDASVYGVAGLVLRSVTAQWLADFHANFNEHDKQGAKEYIRTFPAYFPPLTDTR